MQKLNIGVIWAWLQLLLVHMSTMSEGKLDQDAKPLAHAKARFRGQLNRGSGVPIGEHKS